MLKPNLFFANRSIRVLGGLALAGGGIAFFSGWTAALIIMSGGGLVLTGIVGYCPAWAVTCQLRRK
jgi:hypothetical protein